MTYQPNTTDTEAVEGSMRFFHNTPSDPSRRSTPSQQAQASIFNTGPVTSWSGNTTVSSETNDTGTITNPHIVETTNTPVFGQLPPSSFGGTQHGCFATSSSLPLSKFPKNGLSNPPYDSMPSGTGLNFINQPLQTFQRANLCRQNNSSLFLIRNSTNTFNNQGTKTIPGDLCNNTRIIYTSDQSAQNQPSYGILQSPASNTSSMEVEKNINTSQENKLGTVLHVLRNPANSFGLPQQTSEQPSPFNRISSTPYTQAASNIFITPSSTSPGALLRPTMSNSYAMPEANAQLFRTQQRANTTPFNTSGKETPMTFNRGHESVNPATIFRPELIFPPSPFTTKMLHSKKMFTIDKDHHSSQSTPTVNSNPFQQPQQKIIAPAKLFNHSNSNENTNPTNAPNTNTVFKFNPIENTEDLLKHGVNHKITTLNQCITCMHVYGNKSLEELRWEEYIASVNGATCPGQATKPCNTTSTAPVQCGACTPSGFRLEQSSNSTLHTEFQKPTQSSTQWNQNTTTVYPGQSTNTGFVEKFRPVEGVEYAVKNGVKTVILTRNQCITCMTKYGNKSLEEIHLEDCQSGVKGSIQEKLSPRATRITTQNLPTIMNSRNFTMAPDGRTWVRNGFMLNNSVNTTGNPSNTLLNDPGTSLSSHNTITPRTQPKSFANINNINNSELSQKSTNQMNNQTPARLPTSSDILLNSLGMDCPDDQSTNLCDSSRLLLNSSDLKKILNKAIELVALEEQQQLLQSSFSSDENNSVPNSEAINIQCQNNNVATTSPKEKSRRYLPETLKINSSDITTNTTVQLNSESMTVTNLNSSPKKTAINIGSCNDEDSRLEFFIELKVKVIEDMTKAIVQNQVPGDFATIMVLLPNEHERVITFSLPSEDCTVKDLLDFAEIPCNKDIAVSLVKERMVNINYIIDCRTDRKETSLDVSTNDHEIDLGIDTLTLETSDENNKLSLPDDSKEKFIETVSEMNSEGQIQSNIAVQATESPKTNTGQLQHSTLDTVDAEDADDFVVVAFKSAESSVQILPTSSNLEIGNLSPGKTEDKSSDEAEDKSSPDNTENNCPDDTENKSSDDIENESPDDGLTQEEIEMNQNSEFPSTRTPFKERRENIQKTIEALMNYKILIETHSEDTEGIELDANSQNNTGVPLTMEQIENVLATFEEIKYKLKNVGY